ncbi:hypothetical protein [Chryseobacterium sp. BIGb0232]|uniref:hypothetical protein n=1 Tax=Chryseobacterium sp. BIGb0232 TaxID=2940598 RepID=UPI00162189DB|nr:hypothetical protein [Chryseobacterium sp. BIGb0232]MCS4301898.1 hypothetical protein [Chryseobacterium sp. BIGb0232]
MSSYYSLFLKGYFQVGQPFRLGIPGTVGQASSLSNIPSLSGYGQPWFSMGPISFGH